MKYLLLLLLIALICGSRVARSAPPCVCPPGACICGATTSVDIFGKPPSCPASASDTSSSSSATTSVAIVGEPPSCPASASDTSFSSPATTSVAVLGNPPSCPASTSDVSDYCPAPQSQPTLSPVSFPEDTTNLPRPYAITWYTRQTSELPYTHVQLVLTWPPGIVREKLWPDVDTGMYHIHGLWAADKHGDGVFGCNVWYNPTDTSEPLRRVPNDIVRDLEINWPSYQLPHNFDPNKPITRKKASEEMWRVEFNKHGSCILLLSLNGYFRRALSIKKEFKIHELLTQAKIFPDDTEYTHVQFSEAFKSYIGENIKIVLTCQSKTSFLQQIVLCMDSYARDFISCPSTYMDRPNPKKFGCPTVDSPVTYQRNPNAI